MKLAHRLVTGVGKDIEEMLFNTAIAKMMEFINAFSKLDHYPREALEMGSLRWPLLPLTWQRNAGLIWVTPSL